MQIIYHIQECLTRCFDLQTRYTRWGEQLAIAELMRMAVLEDPSQATVIAICRMFFMPKTIEPLRPPSLGKPWFLGETSEQDWPLQPVHLYRGIPFFIVQGWSVAGLPEQTNWYLAYCIISGIWKQNEFMDVSQDELILVTHDFIRRGPWRRPLNDSEKSFLLSQVEFNRGA